HRCERRVPEVLCYLLKARRVPVVRQESLEKVQNFFLPFGQRHSEAPTEIRKSTESQYIPKMHRNARGVLQPIVAAKEAEIQRLRPRALELRRAAESMPPIRPFADVLRGPNVQLIAEFKRRSPSAGWIQEAAMIADVLPVYETAG